MALKKNTKKPKSTGHIKVSGVRRHRYGPLVVVLFIILLACAVFVGYKVIKSFDEPVLQKTDNSNSSHNTSDDNSSTSSQPNSESTKEEDLKKELTREEGKEKTDYEGTNANNSDTLTGIVNYVGLIDSSVTIRVAIDQIIASGTCDFVLTSPLGKTYNFSNSTTSGPSSTYCGLSISLTDLGGERGVWKVSTMVKSDNGKSGKISGEGTV